MLFTAWFKMIFDFQVLMWRASLLEAKQGGMEENGDIKKASFGTRGDPSSLLDYFPSVQNDASKVTWAHRVNSVKLLKESLRDDEIMMLEADILMGKVKGSPTDSRDLPIMAHPPEKESDLSFDDFLDSVIAADSGKGIKLDFKDIESVEPCLKKLKFRSSELNIPVWLNADIIAGPIKAKRTPIDADTFLSTCKSYFPKATLSVGWTVDVPKIYLGGGAYSIEHAEVMVGALRRNEVTQPVTFPVFGLFAHNSVKTFTWLLDAVPNSTLTVWGGKMDAPYHNKKVLAKMRDELGRDRVYFDVPYKLPKT